jgi:hypothetical protein
MTYTASTPEAGLLGDTRDRTYARKVWCSNTINHLRDPVAGLRALAALACAGGAGVRWRRWRALAALACAGGAGVRWRRWPSRPDAWSSARVRSCQRCISPGMPGLKAR